MMSLEIFASMDSDTRLRLTEQWELIGELSGELGCRATEYAIHRSYREALRDNEFQAIILFGKKGGGKSTYSIRSVATYLMRAEGMSCGEAYQEALMRLAFTAKDLLDKVGQHDIIVWDDAGLWASTYMWFDPVMRHYLQALLDWYDVIRTDVSVLVMSTPTKKKLPPKIRDDPDTILGRVNKHGIIHYKDKRIKQSVVVAARNTEGLYDDRVFRTEMFRDHFMVYLPDPVYEFYRTIRKWYSQYAREKLRSVISVIEEAGGSEGDITTALLRKKLGLEE